MGKKGALGCKLLEIEDVFSTTDVGGDKEKRRN